MTSPRDTLLEQLPLIEKIVRAVCRGRRMDAAEIEEFAAFVRLRLVEKDYAIIRKFQGRSKFGTFLTTVVSRLLTDYRDRDWGGRWRNSAEAKRMGRLAEDLERLTVRDMRSLDEAFAELSATHPGTKRSDLEKMVVRFPTRHRPRMNSLEECEQEAVSNGVDIAKAETTSRISEIVSTFVAGLPREDRLIFQLRFEEDLPVPRIALVLHLDMQSLYRRLRRHFGDLRRALEEAGINKEDVGDLAGPDGALLDFHLKINDERPSNDDEGRVGAPEENAP